MAVLLLLQPSVQQLPRAYPCLAASLARQRLRPAHQLLVPSAFAYEPAVELRGGDGYGACKKCDGVRLEKIHWTGKHIKAP